MTGIKKYLYPIISLTLTFGILNHTYAAQNYAFNWNATNTYGYAVDTPSLSITGDFTIEAWVKPAQQPGKDGEWDPWFKGSTSANDYRLIYLDWTSGPGYLLFSSFRDASNNYTYCRETDANALSTSAWTHIAVSWDVSVPSCIITRNGVAQGVTLGLGNATSIRDTANPLYIGSPAEAYPGYIGLMDEVRVYNVARTEAQIASDYGAEISSYTNVAMYHKFNNSNVDSTGNGNDLTYVNSPTGYESTDVPFQNPSAGGAIKKIPDPIWIW